MHLSFFLLASIFRKTPHFRGKYRLAKLVHSTFFAGLKLNSAHAWIKMKDGFFVKTNLVNQTDFCAFWCGIYDSKLIRRFVKLFEPDWVVLDVGANIGYYTIPFSLFENCKVYAFEPLASNYSHLQQAIEKNNCKNVVPVNIGLGEENGKYIISETERGGTGNAVITGVYDGTNSKRFVEIRRLDDFYEEHDILRCDFIKLDIEGFEIAFLRGATEVIRKYRPVVFGEFNSYWLKANNHSFEEAWDFFKSLGYGIYQLKPSGSFVEVKTLGQNMENVLFLPTTSLDNNPSDNKIALLRK